MSNNDFEAFLRQKADQAGATELSPDYLHKKDNEVVLIFTSI